MTERLKRLRAYRWSSYRAYAGYAAAPQWLETAELLGRAHRVAARRQAVYRADVRQRLTRGVAMADGERWRWSG